MKDNGTLKFNIDMQVDTFLDQYVIWRMKDILRFESDPKVRAACREIKDYMSSPVEED
jgi:hypothetical protein